VREPSVRPSLPASERQRHRSLRVVGYQRTRIAFPPAMQPLSLWRIVSPTLARPIALLQAIRVALKAPGNLARVSPARRSSGVLSKDALGLPRLTETQPRTAFYDPRRRHSSLGYLTPVSYDMMDRTTLPLNHAISTRPGQLRLSHDAFYRSRTAAHEFPRPAGDLETGWIAPEPVGEAGFEPAASASRTLRANQAALLPGGDQTTRPSSRGRWEGGWPRPRSGPRQGRFV
jgi:hypothetical protein